MTVATETASTREVLARVEEIEEIAGTLPTGDDRGSRLRAVARAQLAAVGPVRPRTAAEILGLTEKTVRAWTEQGIFTTVATTPRLLLDATRVHDVWHVIRDLRTAGKTTGLLEEVYYRLNDQDLLDDDDLQLSLVQVRRREGRLLARSSSGG